jgi:hypothetical protein
MITLRGMVSISGPVWVRSMARLVAPVHADVGAGLTDVLGNLPQDRQRSRVVGLGRRLETEDAERGPLMACNATSNSADRRQ